MLANFCSGSSCHDLAPEAYHYIASSSDLPSCHCCCQVYKCSRPVWMILMTFPGSILPKFSSCSWPNGPHGGLITIKLGFSSFGCFHMLCLSSFVERSQTVCKSKLVPARKPFSFPTLATRGGEYVEILLLLFAQGGFLHFFKPVFQFGFPGVPGTTPSRVVHSPSWMT